MDNRKDKSKKEPSYVETSLGIITTGGHWFHTTGEQIESMAPEIFEHCSLQELIRAAEIWIKSTDSLSLLLYFVLVLVIPPVYAAILVLLFFAFWYTQKSALATPYITPMLKWINKDATLIITSGVFLSWMGISGQYIALALGILFFFLFKLGLLRWGVSILFRKYRSGLPLNDRLMKMIILKYAISHGLEVPQIEDMNRKMRELITRQKEK